MKHIFRSFLINFSALFLTTKLLPGLTYEGGFKTLVIGSITFMLINFLVVPVLKIMFLPLNLLTLGFFAWAVNVVALYFLTAILPQFKIIPFTFEGANLGVVIIPAIEFNTLFVAIIASMLIGFISHFVHWLIR